jgi:PmbA protein
LSEGDDYQERLSQGLEMAALVSNPIFQLPGNGLDYDFVQTVDPEIKEYPQYILDKIQEDLVKKPLEKIKRSSAEIFIENNEFSLINSNGLEKEGSATEILVDFVLLAEKEGALEGEAQGTKRARFYKDLRLSEVIQIYAQYAREALVAQLPQTGSYPVVFSGEALDTLFNFFILQTSGPARFQNWSQFAIGQPIISDLRGEALSLSSNPIIPGAMKSRAFDDNGLPLKRVEVIRDNIFQKRMNNKRYADYLGEEATGAFSNLEVATGARSSEDLLAESPCYHLLRFSTFEPNPITGAFSGEIRTGYFLSKGQKTPIKGGSVSGTMQKAFKEVFFSKERVQREAYLGPMAIRIESLDILGI